jgi:hypothetical protein
MSIRAEHAAALPAELSLLRARDRLGHRVCRGPTRHPAVTRHIAR